MLQFYYEKLISFLPSSYLSACLHHLVVVEVVNMIYLLHIKSKTSHIVLHFFPLQALRKFVETYRKPKQSSLLDSLSKFVLYYQESKSNQSIDTVKSKKIMQRYFHYIFLVSKN